jgi:hypothetical protein
VTVPDVLYPQAAYLHQTRNLVAGRLFEVSQCGDKCQPETVRKFEVIDAYRITQAFDPTSERSRLLKHTLPHRLDPRLWGGRS